MIGLIAGLGNPGPQHVGTRHNAGFQFLDHLASAQNVAFRKEGRFLSETCRICIAEHDIWLVKPMTYMNLSGSAVAAVASYFRIEAASILVAHDELDLPPGVVRLKKGGGAGGHNGLTDIIQRLGTPDFFRLRIGIGHPGTRDMVTPFVLSRASVAEQQLIDDAINESMAVLPLLLEGQVNKAMTQLNRRAPSAVDSTPE